LPTPTMATRTDPMGGALLAFAGRTRRAGS
jgi:hypothetical protein